MDKFILYKENVDVLDNFIYEVGGFLFNIVLGIITIYYLYDLISLPFTPPENKKSDKKEIFLSITKAIIGLIIVSSLFIATNTKKVKNYKQQFKEQTVQLKDIKELIHVEGDKFFDSYKLIHKDNKITEITKEEYEELTKERTTNE